MDAGVCFFKCGWCDRPVRVFRDGRDGRWYVEFQERERHAAMDPACGIYHIEDASEAVKDTRLFEASQKYDDGHGGGMWYIVDGMMPEALWRLELAGDCGCKCFFDHFCHDMMHRERLEKFERWMAEKKARLAASKEKSRE